MLNQLPRISLTASTGFASKVDEIIGVVVTLTHHIVLGMVQQREELGVEAGFAFRRELVPESPQTAAEDSPEIIHVLSRWHPTYVNLSFTYQLILREGEEKYQRATAS